MPTMCSPERSAFLRIEEWALVSNEHNDIMVTQLDGQP